MTTEEQDRLVRKAVRARSLVDPLGAMGYRTTSTRVDHEARWRRSAFAAVGTCFAAVLGSILVGSGSGKLLANDIPTSQSVSELWAPTAMSVPTTAAPSESWRFDDDDDDDEAYSGSYSAAQEIQVLPAPSQNGAVTAPQAPSQPSHGRTGGS